MVASLLKAQDPLLQFPTRANEVVWCSPIQRYLSILVVYNQTRVPLGMTVVVSGVSIVQQFCVLIKSNVDEFYSIVGDLMIIK
jgi:hypothetical protein